MRKLRPLLAALSLLFAGNLTAAQSVAGGALERDFNRRTKPLLKEFCLDCHSTEKQKGDLDLERFSTLHEIKRHPKVWQGIIEQIINNEMPPKDKPQPTSQQREQFLSWINADEAYLARVRPGLETA